MVTDSLTFAPERNAVESVPISALQVGDSPRRGGEDLDHVRVLAESERVLPPILVHRATMRVIDGMHRLRVAILRNMQQIDVVFFDGDEKDAFVLAVRTNTTHGLPLSLAERSTAAGRIIKSHPHWSDRVVAAVTGLSPKTVGSVRRRSVQETQSAIRVGRDGRTRPVNGKEGRDVAMRIFAEHPTATIRQVAKAAGISLATAHDVRNRLRQGDDPIPAKQRPKPLPAAEPTAVPKVRGTIMPSLRKDPSLRLTESGRTLLRLLEVCSVGPDEWHLLLENVPRHCLGMVAQVARECADTWRTVAEQMESIDLDQAR